MDMDTAKRTTRFRHPVRDLAVVAVGLLLGLGFAFGPRILDDAGAEKTTAPPSGAVPLASLSTQQVANASVSAGQALAAAPAVPDPPAAAASSPRATVGSFLTAEAASDYDVSYGFLSAADRVRVGGRTPWVAAHADVPQITGFVVDGTYESGNEATITTATDLRSSLDRIVGLVPAHARELGRGAGRRGMARRLQPQPPRTAVPS